MTTVETEAPVTYTSPEMVELSGITYRQLDYWCRTNRLPDNAHGSGSVRRFTDRDVQFARNVKALLDYDLSLDRACSVALSLVHGSRVVHIAGDVLIVITAIDPTEPPNPEGEQA